MDLENLEDFNKQLLFIYSQPNFRKLDRQFELFFYLYQKRHRKTNTTHLETILDFTDFCKIDIINVRTASLITLTFGCDWSLFIYDFLSRIASSVLRLNWELLNYYMLSMRVLRRRF